MNELQQSNSEVPNIVKTIDEIAFQTNILALNSAVEAATAGDAGSGFAVVAQEARSLAQRSAEAAKEKASKIQSALEKSEEGGSISKEVAVNFSVIASEVQVLDSLIEDIARAFAEQTEGIGQINCAVTQLDSVMQDNASSADKAAASTEQLNSQAGRLDELVSDLLVLVGGRARQGSGQTATASEGFEVQSLHTSCQSSPGPSAASANSPSQGDQLFAGWSN